jgi:hypothetical protein
MNLTQKPPMQGVGAPESNSVKPPQVGGKTAQAKWSINIQDIVKRSQNMDFGPSSQKAGNHPILDSNQQKTFKGVLGSSSTKDKNSLLYFDLKKKLQYENGQTGELSSGSNLMVRKAESMGGLGTTFNSEKIIRPASAQMASKNLYLAN